MTQRLDKDSNKEHYNTHGLDDLERAATAGHRLHALELIVPWVTAAVPADARILDIAGGSGPIASQIVRASSASVVGLDISEVMVGLREHDPQLPHNVVGDMEALPFRPETFDAVLFVAALHHVPDPLPTLREAWRVLRPDGQLFAYEPCSLKARKAGILPIPGIEKEFRFSVAWLGQQIRDGGFRIDELGTRRIAVRLLEQVSSSPSLRVYEAGDRVDRVLGLVPGYDRLGTMGMIRATKQETR